MGRYIQGPALGKIETVEELGGVVIPQPGSFNEIPEGMGLVCVVNNGPFEAAAWCYDEREFADFTLPSDGRPKTWLILDKAICQEHAK